MEPVLQASMNAPKKGKSPPPSKEFLEKIATRGPDDKLKVDQGRL